MKTEKNSFPIIGYASLFVFAASLALYWITADRNVSYWDAPEYVTTASLLEIGHPPGNPIWTLAMRVATIPFPRESHALVINLWSGIFMALASMFLCRIIYEFILWTLDRKRPSMEPIESRAILRERLTACLAAVGGSLCFSFSDSVWFSAVESEVYAMATFLMALCLRLMVALPHIKDPGKKQRYLILIAYITGLSLGVHQLCLLCIPVYALIFIFHGHRKITLLRIIATLLLSLGIIACILTGMMPGIIDWACRFELYSANNLQQPYFFGVFFYLFILFGVFLLSLSVAQGKSPIVKFFLMSLFFWLGGFFIFGGNLIAGGVFSIILSFILNYRWSLQKYGQIFVWMGGFLILGFSSYALILIRSYASPPMNEGAPSDIFAFSSYLSREQYGSTPLLYGPTPYSQPLFEESREGETDKPLYTRYLLKKGKPKYVVAAQEPRLYPRSRFLTEKDSLNNKKIAEREGGGYLLADYLFNQITTPELNMWFPRITSRKSQDIESYANWIGMEKENMVEVEVSETIDSLGNFQPKIGPSGEREPKTSHRPTYLQNFGFFLTYQAGYMYFRYLLWNFFGRQNDMPSKGELEHGNLVTSIPALDKMMTGDIGKLPAEIGSHNKGRNNYFGIPFYIGILGIVWLCTRHRRGKRILWVTTVFFIMTGLAIVAYLNQNPGEPRERDYSFLGSYMAFAIWIGFGLLALIRFATRIVTQRRITFILPVVLAFIPSTLMAIVNFDDHDRRGRNEPTEYASEILDGELSSYIFTQGDNFTFPLWYAQEVLGKGERHTVVDITYLTTPEYIVNLMKQGQKGFTPGVKAADIIYGAYTFVKLPEDADTTPIPLRTALDEMHANRVGQPTFRHSRVIMRGRSSRDTIVLSLKDFTGGSSVLPFRQLMLLEMISQVESQDDPKALLFLSQIDPKFYKAILPATRQGVFGRIYAPNIPDSVYEEFFLSDLHRLMGDSVGNNRLPNYIDPVVADRHRRKRGAMIMGTKYLLDKGKNTEANEIAGKIDSLVPFDRVLPGNFTVTDSTFHEGTAFTRLLMELYEANGRKDFLEKAFRHNNAMKKRNEEWYDYYRSLNKRQKNAVSNETLRILSEKREIETLDSILNELVLISGR